MEQVEGLEALTLDQLKEVYRENLQASFTDESIDEFLD
jgi:hypothetical protein